MESARRKAAGDHGGDAGARDKSPKARQDLTVTEVRSRFVYDAASGRLSHGPKTTLRGHMPKDRRAGTLHPASGYRRVNIGGVSYTEHRVIWLHVYGEWPDGEVDHINHDRADNRLANLRVLSRQENALWRVRNGTVFRVKDGKWRAQIRQAKALYRLGYFKTAEAGRAAIEKFLDEHPELAARRKRS